MPPPTLDLPATMTDKSGRAFLVRRLDPADRDELRHMYDDFLPKRAAQGLPPESPELRGRWLDDVLDRGEHAIVEVDGRVMGHGMLIPLEDRDDGAAELANFLHQSVRNRGIGTRLNRVLLELARDAGFRRVWLSVEPSNRAAIKSYEYVGFRRLPGSFWAPEIEMEVPLEDGPDGPPDPPPGRPGDRAPGRDGGPER